MGFAELDESPRKAELMVIAATLQQGIGEGEYLRELNPVYQKKQAEMRKQLEAARK